MIDIQEINATATIQEIDAKGQIEAIVVQESTNDLIRYYECKFQVGASSVTYLNSTEINFSEVPFSVFAPLVAYYPKDGLEVLKNVMGAEGTKRETVSIATYGVSDEPAVIITGFGGRSLVGDIYLFRWDYELGPWDGGSI